MPDVRMQGLFFVLLCSLFFLDRLHAVIGRDRDRKNKIKKKGGRGHGLDETATREHQESPIAKVAHWAKKVDSGMCPRSADAPKKGRVSFLFYYYFFSNFFFLSCVLC
nr:hypothetical protein [Pandoravirus aubagnensis]